MANKTMVSISGDRFLINGEPTYPGAPIEGRLMNSRMVQATFDDLNPQTRSRWDRPGARWDARRNTDEFIAQLPVYCDHGLLAFTVNLQGGSPEGYSETQPWHNSGFHADGRLRGDYVQRMNQIIDAADALGMAVILGLFYFGQDQRLDDEAAVGRACDEVTDWLVARRDRNVLVEIANEADLGRVTGKVFYDHPILRIERGEELVRRVQKRSEGKIDNAAGRLLVSTSQCGGQALAPEIADAVDFVLLHGNGVDDPRKLTEMIERSRGTAGYRGQPIVVNEDDHFGFDRPKNNLAAAVGAGASWGYFDYRRPGEGFEQGYQSVPVDWSVGSDRKQGFFAALRALASEWAE
ncbi:MAG: hypothetical protein AAF333_11640 [Planctomycetota bacterium]